MNEIWKVAVTVAGLGAIGAMVLWSLYRQWLRLGIFQRLTRKHQFALFILFLVLTFVFALAALLTYVVVNLADNKAMLSNSTMPTQQTKTDWHIEVFDFRNFGQYSERENSGGKLSEHVLSHLLEADRDIRRNPERETSGGQWSEHALLSRLLERDRLVRSSPDVPPAVFSSRSEEISSRRLSLQMSLQIMMHGELWQRTPFFAVMGSVLDVNDSHCRAFVRVTAFQSPKVFAVMMTKTYHSGVSDDEMQETAKGIATDIQAALSETNPLLKSAPLETPMPHREEP